MRWPEGTEISQRRDIDSPGVKTAVGMSSRSTSQVVLNHGFLDRVLTRVGTAWGH